MIFIKTCLVKTAEIICSGNLTAFQNISLTRNTQRITNLAYNLNNQIKIKITIASLFFSIPCDKSTDIGSTVNLIVFFMLARWNLIFLNSYWKLY